MDLNLKGKKVLITGGTKGIGQAIAVLFAEEGADVAVAARGEDDLERLSQKFTNIRTYKVDVTKQDERIQLIENVVKDFQGIDILINNAGGSMEGKR